MGDRISVQFQCDGNRSVVLFNHWGGEEFLEEAIEYAKLLKKEGKDKGSVLPLYRLEPETVMVDFIRHITKKMERVENDLYLGATERDGDNGNHGNHIIDLKTGQCVGE